MYSMYRRYAGVLAGFRIGPLLYPTPSAAAALSQVHRYRMLSTSGSSPLPSGVKPPNIFIYQPDKDSTSKEYSQVRDSLVSCLTPEHYVIYPLGVDDVVHYSPWKENCRLLVVPSLNTEHAHKSHDQGLSARVVEEFVTYVQAGGRLLSMHAQLNGFLGLLSIGEARDKRSGRADIADKLVYCQDGVCEVEVLESTGGAEQKYRFSSLVPDFSEVRNGCEGVYLSGAPLSQSIESRRDLGFLVPLEWNVDMELNFNQSNNNQSDQPPLSVEQKSHTIPCVCEAVFKNKGRVILSSVDLLPTIPNHLKLAQLVRLKRGVALRRQYLMHLLGGFGLECSEENLPDLTSTFLLCSHELRSRFLSTMAPLQSGSVIPGKDSSLHFISTDNSQGSPVDLPKPMTSDFTVITQPDPMQVKNLPFSSEEYFQELKTRELGRTLLYTPVITSTQLPFTGNMSFCHALQSEMGVVWVARQQTKGKGRSGNSWISPVGSMMFSMPLHLPSSTRLSTHLPLLQHIVGVAVVDSVRSLPGYEDVPICIKWPNDIYYKSQVKLGGILVSCLSLSSISSHTAIIGCGVNISNEYPTMSVNDAITLYNKEAKTSLPPLSVEGVLAGTLNCLERLLTLYEVQGLDQVLELYYKYWIHSNATVTLASYGEEKATVVGIDEYGYLRVRRNGEMLSLQPDGNSFDITKGLIVMKK